MVWDKPAIQMPWSLTEGDPRACGVADAIGIGQGASADDETGLLIERTVRPGVSGVLRLSVHRGLTLRSAGGARFLAEAPVASTLWCAYYGAAILRRPWEPFDQPAASAYMPLPLRAFEQVATSPNGLLLIQSVPTVAPFCGTVIDDGCWRRSYLVRDPDGSTLAVSLTSFLIDFQLETTERNLCMEALLDIADRSWGPNFTALPLDLVSRRAGLSVLSR